MHNHTYGQFRVFNKPNMNIWGVWGGKLEYLEKFTLALGNMLTPHRKVMANIQTPKARTMMQI